MWLKPSWHIGHLVGRLPSWLVSCLDCCRCPKDLEAACNYPIWLLHSSWQRKGHETLAWEG